MRRIVCLGTVLSLAPGCGGSAPSAPSPGSALAMACSAPSVLAGDVVICKATVGLVNVSFDASWTSSDPSVAMSNGGGAFTGRSNGQVTLTATHLGKAVSAPLSVDLQDVIRATASTVGGSFKVGAAATMWLQGFYGVASADAGTLTLVITDQSGSTVSTSEPLTVPRGGNQYVMSSSFIVPVGASRVCRTGVLQIGSTTLTAVPAAALAPCIDVVP